MKNIHIRLLSLLFLTPVYSCKDLIFIPVRGEISGYVSDNNGVPLAGVQVSATFSAPSQGQGQPPIPTTITAQSDRDGYYQLSDVWDDVSFSINHSGFLPVNTLVYLSENDRPELDVMLQGSPTIGTVTLDRATLSTDSDDTLSIQMEVQDVYNNNSQIYTGNFLLKRDNGFIAAIIPATLLSQSLDHYLFQGVITAADLPAGTYSMKAEVRDPDGNTHQVNVSQMITIE